MPFAGVPEGRRRTTTAIEGEAAMNARLQMNPAAARGYEITADDGPALRLPPGPQASRIFDRWRTLRDANDPRADAYLEGLVEGMRVKTVLTGARGGPLPQAQAKDDDGEYESDRSRQLAENRQSAAEQNVDLDESFGPGSFGCHEVMHLAGVLAGVIERELCNHSAVLRDPRWYACARRACDDLAQLYLAMGKAHL